MVPGPSTVAFHAEVVHPLHEDLLRSCSRQRDPHVARSIFKDLTDFVPGVSTGVSSHSHGITRSAKMR